MQLLAHFVRISPLPARVALGRARRGPLVPTWSYSLELMNAVMRRSVRAMLERAPTWGRKLQRRTPTPPVPRWARSLAPELESVASEDPGLCIEHAASPDDGPVVFYVHGGGYTVGHPNTYRSLLALLVRDGGRVYAPCYPLAPEHSVHEALDHLEAALREVAQRHASQPLFLAGDSAGGALALSLARRVAADPSAREAVPLRGVLALSPWVDPGAELETPDNPGAGVDMLTPDFVAWCANHASTRTALDDPALTLTPDLPKAMPPLLIHDGARELFAPQIANYVDGLRAAGIEVEHERWPHMFHVFQLAVGLAPSANDSIAKMRAWMKHRLDVASPDEASAKR